MMMTSGSGVNYKSMFDAGSQIIAKEGTESLFKGAGANILCGVAGAGVLSLYDKLQEVMFGKVYSGTRPLQWSNVPLDIHPEVRDALTRHRPVVALETAVVTHGLPSPTNLTVQLALEDILRSTGSIPATIRIIQGRIKIGLKKLELERLAETKTDVKVSWR